MARTDIELIQQVLNTSVENADIFIAMANGLVDEIVVGGTPEPSYDRLQQIETLLAAHFITVYEPVAQSDSAGRGWATYLGKTGYMLWTAIHGQMAVLLDTTGGLAALQNDATDKDKTNEQPKVAWVGTGFTKRK